MRINRDHASTILREEARQAQSGNLDMSWVEKVEALSRLCEAGVAKTHIAFLGTVMLAKSVTRDADLFAIKPGHTPHNPHAFSARTLCHSVLVPLAAELGISLGVTGREPLNNQPYFRMRFLGDDTPVHAGGRAAFDYMVELIQELQESPDEAIARTALRAFLAVRRRYQPRYTGLAGETTIAPYALTDAVTRFVANNSERGKRAQAVVAGLLDIFAGAERVESGRIHDPSRRYPGDVCVRSMDDATRWEKAIEVRDKPVAVADVQIFARRCLDMAVREAAVVMVAERQQVLDTLALGQWAHEFGIGLTLFHGWDTFVEQGLFWSGLPKPVAASRALRCIHQRLVAVEASPEAVDLWQVLTQGAGKSKA